MVVQALASSFACAATTAFARCCSASNERSPMVSSWVDDDKEADADDGTDAADAGNATEEGDIAAASTSGGAFEAAAADTTAAHAQRRASEFHRWRRCESDAASEPDADDDEADEADADVETAGCGLDVDRDGVASDLSDGSVEVALAVSVPVACARRNSLTRC